MPRLGAKPQSHPAHDDRLRERGEQAGGQGIGIVGLGKPRGDDGELVGTEAGDDLDGVPELA